MKVAGKRAPSSRRRIFRLQSPGWFFGAALLAVAAAVPLLVIVGHLLMPQQEVWKHLAENVLGTLVANTALLLACIVPLTAIMGVGLGWLTGACDYPGRKFFAWALVLPFAIPPYVFAFVYLGLFDFSGPVQGALRTVFPSLGFVDIRSGFGVATILSLAFYPYVYLMARSAFMTQGRTAMEAARTMGMKPSRAFFKVALPMARPFVAAGVVLVCMESLADFGAVSIFNYDTFTTAIYKAWFGLFLWKALPNSHRCLQYSYCRRWSWSSECVHVCVTPKQDALVRLIASSSPVCGSGVRLQLPPWSFWWLLGCLARSLLCGHGTPSGLMPSDIWSTASGL